MSDCDGDSFWRGATLSDLTQDQWEALCDGCGKCCLFRFEDEETGHVVATHIACRLLEPSSCRCKDYPNRRTQVPDCVVLTPQRVAAFSWLPATCAYRLVAEGRELPWWHHLVSGSRETVHEAGMSMRARTVSEVDTDIQLWENHILDEGGGADGD